MRRSRWTTWCVAALVLAVSLIGALPAAVGSTAPPEAAGGIASVVARDADVTVAGSAPAGASVQVFALGTEEDPAAWAVRPPVATVTAEPAGTFAASVPRGGAPINLYYAKYVAVVDGQAVGTYRYVDHNQVTPTNSYPYPHAATKKGLQVQMTADADDLGIGHAGINVAFNALMQKADADATGPSDDPLAELLNPPPPDSTITFVSGGREFYFNRHYVESLDRQIKPLSDKGQVVNLILILYRDESPNSAFHELVHPDWDPAGGPVFAFNTKTADGVARYTAAIEFIADRWTRADERHGRATGFIVGNEIDAQWVWSNMGEKPIDEFLLYYERALRLTDLAVRASYSEGRTYTSLTSSWTAMEIHVAEPQRHYPGRDVIDGLNALSKQHGDYPWYVAHHPYPEDLFDPAFWHDTTATDDLDTTQRITFKDIELLNDYLMREELKYGGTPRRIILSEQGCHTPGTDEEAELLQAACYALAYYKIHFLEAIDSFILHRHVDFKAEGGLRLGLWTWDEDRPEQSSPGRQKPIYEVFKHIDTERSLEVTEFAKEIIGINDWSELVDGWDPDKLAVRQLARVGGVSSTAEPHQPTTLFDFSDGTQGWSEADAVDSVHADSGHLTATFSYHLSQGATIAKLWRGSQVELPEPLDLTATPYLSATVRIPYYTQIGPRYAKVRAYGADGTVGEGTARLADSQDWQQVTLDLSDWAGRAEVKRIKVWLRGSTNADWSGTFELDDVQAAALLHGHKRANNIDLEVTAPDGIDSGSPVHVTVTNNDMVALQGTLEVEPCLGLLTDPSSLHVAGLPPGGRRTFDLTISVAALTDPAAPTMCFSLVGAEYTQAVHVPPPSHHLLYGFDDGTTQGWQPGQNVTTVQAVTGFANGPGRPYEGSHALDGTTTNAPATAPRAMFVAPAVPLDLSEARVFVIQLNSYGGVPGATGYETTLTLTTGRSSTPLVGSVTEPTTIEVTRTYSPDRWNEISLDISGWSGRSAVTRIEISMRAVGTDFPGWGAHFQVDSVGWYSRPRT